MNDQSILIARQPFTVRRGRAEADTSAPCRAGAPTTLHEVAHVQEGEIVMCDAERASELFAKRRAFPAVFDGPLAVIAPAVLPSWTAEEAALAAWPHARVWHAVRDGNYFVPAPCPGRGITRGPFTARFESEAKARRFFHEKPEATPLFIYETPYALGAVIWRPGVLTQIPTSIHRVGG